MYIMTWVTGVLFLILHAWAITSLVKSQKELRRKQDFTLKVVESGLLMIIKEGKLIKSVFGIQYVLHKKNRKLIVITSEGEEKVTPHARYH